MADTVNATGLRVQQWDDKFFVEYIQKSRFAKYQGTDENSVIQVKEDLTKKKGDRITYALINKLTNDATLGSNTLEGNEEDMVSRSHALTVNKRRNAIRIPEMEQQKSALDLRSAARRGLLTWSQEDTRDQIIDALGSFNGVVYASASEAQKDAWLVDNADRVLFGAAKSNNSANDHSASLANIDNTADKFLSGPLELLKRLALSANPKIKPITVNEDKRFYVCFAGTRTFRDLRTDSTIRQAQRDVVLRMQNIKLFEGGDIEWDGIIVHEVDDIPVYTGVGAGAIDVSPVYLCGAQALGMGWAKRWKSVTKEFDYGDKFGVAIESIMGIEKLNFGSGAGDTDDLKQNGVVTGYFAAVADT